jgi:SAM-dependent methyltransferase
LNNSHLSSFSEQDVKEFWEKGSKIFEEWIKPYLFDLPAHGDKMNILEFGCGIGRVLRNFNPDLHNVTGIDISPIVITECKEFYPDFNFFCNRENDMTFLQSANFDLVFSFDVFNHISKFSVFQHNLVNLCRVTKTRGKLLLELGCEDFQKEGVNQTNTTVNFEDYSRHFYLDGEYQYTHKQDNSSGVQISFDFLQMFLLLQNVKVLSVKHHNFNLKPSSLWFICEKF